MRPQSCSCAGRERSELLLYRSRLGFLCRRRRPVRVSREPLPAGSLQPPHGGGKRVFSRVSVLRAPAARLGVGGEGSPPFSLTCWLVALGMGERPATAWIRACREEGGHSGLGAPPPFCGAAGTLGAGRSPEQRERGRSLRGLERGASSAKEEYFFWRKEGRWWYFPPSS